MPAKDKYHDSVVRALQEDGWQIADEQITLPVENRNLWVDIEAFKPEIQRIILIEVKGFENISSPINYFQQLIGQYIMYRVAMRYWKLDDKSLFLAIPQEAYLSFFQEEITQLMIAEVQLKLMIFDPEKELITEWIN